MRRPRRAPLLPLVTSRTLEVNQMKQEQRNPQIAYGWRTQDNVDATTRVKTSTPNAP